MSEEKTTTKPMCVAKFMLTFEDGAHVLAVSVYADGSVNGVSGELPADMLEPAAKLSSIALNQIKVARDVVQGVEKKPADGDVLRLLVPFTNLVLSEIASNAGLVVTKIK